MLRVADLGLRSPGPGAAKGGEEGSAGSGRRLLNVRCARRRVKPENTRCGGAMTTCTTRYGGRGPAGSRRDVDRRWVFRGWAVDGPGISRSTVAERWRRARRSNRRAKSPRTTGPRRRSTRGAASDRRRRFAAGRKVARHGAAGAILSFTHGGGVSQIHRPLPVSGRPRIASSQAHAAPDSRWIDRSGDVVMGLPPPGCVYGSGPTRHAGARHAAAGTGCNLSAFRTGVTGALFQLPE
jgi:hypothetical protein